MNTVTRILEALAKFDAEASAITSQTTEGLVWLYVAYLDNKELLNQFPDEEVWDCINKQWRRKVGVNGSRYLGLLRLMKPVPYSDLDNELRAIAM